jgi:hypothetical protein
MKFYELFSLLVSLLSVLTACATPLPTPTTSVPTVVPPTIAPTPTEFASGIPVFPKLGTGEPAGDEEPPGLYKPPAGFALPFTFQTNKVYRGMYFPVGAAQLFGIGQGKAYQPEKSLYFWAVKPEFSADRVLSDLRATEGMTSTKVQEVKVAGLAGRQFDATSEGILAIPALGSFIGYSGDSWHTVAHPHLRFFVSTLSGRTLLIYTEAPQEEWDAFLADTNQVLGTVKFAP